MHEDVHLGRIAGLPVAMNWSVVVVVMLLTWSLAAAVLPEVATGYGTATYWLAGAIGALVFFGCLLAHEIAHAIVARRAGVEVKGLTLWLFGGVAKLGGEPPTPQADLRIAAAGPLTSLGLAVGFLGLAMALGGVGAPDLLVALMAWLATINLLLGVFNLIPGAPLDGGRVLRALLWRRHGDQVRAALSAARAGRVVGYVLIWLGLVELLMLPGIGGLWLVFIGWFVLSASRAEGADVIARHVLRGVRAQDVMTRSPLSVPASITVQDLIEHYLLGYRHSAYPVEDTAGRVVGLVTLRQVRGVAAGHRATTRVADVALPLTEVPRAAPGQLLIQVLEELGDSTGGRILVFDGQDLVGIITQADVARAIDVRTLSPGGNDGPAPQSTGTPHGVASN